MKNSVLPGQQAFLSPSGTSLEAMTPPELVQMLPGSKPLPFSQEKSKVPQSVFKKRFAEEKLAHPFDPVYLGQTNPYTGISVHSESDYYEYLREHTYHILCDEYAANIILSIDAQFSRSTSKLHDDYDELRAKYSAAEKSYRRKFRGLAAALVFFFAFSLLSASNIISFGQRTPVRSYEDGYASGVAAQKAADADLYAHGYAAGEADQKAADAGQYDAGYKAGKADGYAVGKSDGVREGKVQGRTDGYSEGYDKGYQDGSAGTVTWWEQYKQEHGLSGSDTSTRSNGSSSSGTTRDEPVADTYIGNKNSKKFHLPTCSYLPNQSNQVTFNSREEALAAGYDPCGHCKP